MEVKMIRNRLRVIREWIRRFGVMRYLGHALIGIFKFSRLDKPAVYQKLMKSASQIEFNPFVMAKCGKEIASLNVETNNLLAVLGDRISRGKFPLNWNSGLQSALLLYLLVRNYNVHKVLEVGTGNGVSSLAFIEALAKNSSKSEFITVDVSKDAGSILNASERDTIQVKTINPDLVSKRQFFDTLQNFHPDLVFIDGAHDYLNVINDLELSFALRPKVLVADDIEVNDAWQVFCAENNLEYSVFFDGRKVLGVCFIS